MNSGCSKRPDSTRRARTFRGLSNALLGAPKRERARCSEFTATKSKIVEVAKTERLTRNLKMSERRISVYINGRSDVQRGRSRRDDVGDALAVIFNQGAVDLAGNDPEIQSKGFLAYSRGMDTIGSSMCASARRRPTRRT